MAWGSEHAAVAAFARELRCYRAEHGRPTIAEINIASEQLALPRHNETQVTDGMSETLSAGRISETMAGKGSDPPTKAMVFSFVRAVLHLEDPSAEPIIPSHPDVEEMFALRGKAFARQDLGVFRKRHLRTALRNSKAAEVRYGCFALYALNGSTLHIGSTTSETLAASVEAVLIPTPDAPVIDREHVAELELWPMPDLATSPDAEATVARVKEALVLRAVNTYAPEPLRLPRQDTLDESDIPEPHLFPLVDSGTLLAVREALRDQAANFAVQASIRYSRTESLFKRQQRSSETEHPETACPPGDA